MRISLVVALTALLLLSPCYYSQGMASSMASAPSSLVYPGAVPPKNLPNLPPDQKQPKELPPSITVTTPHPSLPKPEKVCANYNFTIRWSYLGNIGGAVNIKLSSKTIATNVPVQGGQGSYSWKALDSFAWKGTEIHTVIVEAVNGAAVGTGGKIEVYSSKTPCAMK